MTFFWTILILVLGVWLGFLLVDLVEWALDRFEVHGLNSDDDRWAR